MKIMQIVANHALTTCSQVVMQRPLLPYKLLLVVSSDMIPFVRLTYSLLADFYSLALLAGRGRGRR